MSGYLAGVVISPDLAANLPAYEYDANGMRTKQVQPSLDEFALERLNELTELEAEYATCECVVSARRAAEAAALAEAEQQLGPKRASFETVVSMCPALAPFAAEFVAGKILTHEESSIVTLWNEQAVPAFLAWERVYNGVRSRHMKGVRADPNCQCKGSGRILTRKGRRGRFINATFAKPPAAIEATTVGSAYVSGVAHVIEVGELPFALLLPDGTFVVGDERKSWPNQSRAAAMKRFSQQEWLEYARVLLAPLSDHQLVWMSVDS